MTEAPQSSFLRRPYIAVAAASDANGQTILQAYSFLEEAFGYKPELDRLQDLAGPNNTLQILLDSANWLTLLKFLLATGGTAFIAKFSAQAAEALYSRLPVGLQKKTGVTESPAETAHAHHLARFANQIQTARRQGTSVVFGFRLDAAAHPRGNLGIELKEGKDEEIVRVAAILTLIGPSLERTIDGILADADAVLSGVAHNSDFSGKIELSKDGGAEIYLQVRSRINPEQRARTIRLVYGPDGKELQ